MPHLPLRPGDPLHAVTAGVLTLDEVCKLIGEVIQPAHFFVKSPLILQWQQLPSEECAWEIYQGRLLDPDHTRLRQTFASWNIFCIKSGNRSAEPLLSVKLDVAGRLLHVTRAIYCYAWEGYHAGDNIYLSRPTRKWLPELVGTIPLDRFHDLEELRQEIRCLLFQAVVGCSRLPLQSLEAPLPAFSLGSLAYFDRANNERGGVVGPVPLKGDGPSASPSEPARRLPMKTFRDLIEYALKDGLTCAEKAKLLETLLRSTASEELASAAELFMGRWHALGYSSDEFIRLCRTLFNEVALSPYTDFVDKLLDFLNTMESHGHLAAEAHIDFLSDLLRQNVRHLTAYDLITFHHRGANYPDALLLNTVLQAYLGLLETHPDFYLVASSDDTAKHKQKRLRRRALRQAWLLRLMVEGLPIPQAPTSPGENCRVLPPPFEPIPLEQILEPGKRTMRLFEGEPLHLPGECSRLALQQCVADLQHPEELHELGMAVFLDRPLGIGKAATEPDRTLLFSYVTFSLAVAKHRLRFLASQHPFNLVEEAFERYLQGLLSPVLPKGIPITPGRWVRKPGAVALCDAASVAEDFIVLRTTRRAVNDFLQQFDFSALGKRVALDYLDPRRRLLIASAVSTRFGPEGILDIYDEHCRRRLELQIDLSQGYESRAGQEYPAAGLRVLRAWDAGSPDGIVQEHDLESEGIMLPPQGRFFRSRAAY